MAKWLKVLVLAVVVFAPLLSSVVRASADDSDPDGFSVVWGD